MRHCCAVWIQTVCWWRNCVHSMYRQQPMRHKWTTWRQHWLTTTRTKSYWTGSAIERQLLKHFGRSSMRSAAHNSHILLTYWRIKEVCRICWFIWFEQPIMLEAMIIHLWNILVMTMLDDTHLLAIELMRGIHSHIVLLESVLSFKSHLRRCDLIKYVKY